MSTDVERVQFNGRWYRRYPNARSESDRRYFARSCCAADGRRGVIRLHRDVWEFHHGPLPEGWHVHHIDENTLNNDVSNLCAMPGSEHLSQHGQSQSPELLARRREHMARLRPLAAEWHRSEAGRVWHAQHGKAVAAMRQPKPGTCEQCGKAYESKRPVRFCGNNCKSKWRRAAGLDDVERPCAKCGAGFITNRYSGVRYCASCHRRSSSKPNARARVLPDGGRAA